MRLVLLLLALVVAVAVAHPTKYPDAKKLQLKGGQLPPFRSYHIHVMFLPHHNDTCTGYDNAMTLRQQFIDTFHPSEPECQGDFDQGRLCMFPVAHKPYGPFVAPEWAAFIPLEYFHQAVPWIMQNRGPFDVFVHPNSGWEREDHQRWGIWGGYPWRLDLADPEFQEELFKNSSYPLPPNCSDN